MNCDNGLLLTALVAKSIVLCSWLAVNMLINDDDLPINCCIILLREDCCFSINRVSYCSRLARFAAATTASVKLPSSSTKPSSLAFLPDQTRP